MERRVKKETIIGLVIVILFLLSLNVPSLQAQEKVKPGDVIDSGNWQKAEDLLPPKVLEMVKTHGLVIKVDETRDYPWSPEYLEATKKYAGTVKLEDDLAGYKGGLPFPDINLKDPNAGLKMAWNYQYIAAADVEYYPTANFLFINKSGSLERSLYMTMWKIKYVGRTLIPPVPELPNPENVIYKEMLQVYDPKDAAGIGFVQIRYKSEKKDDETWAYVPALRRVRRMSAAQRTDAYLGSDITIEDFYGFSGKVSEYNWKVIGSKKVLGMRNTLKQMNTVDLSAGNKSRYKWCPTADIPWEIRDCWILECASKSKSHPYSKRILYMDSKRMDCLYSEMYDRKGEFWKLWLNPWYWYPQYKVFATGGAYLVDFQAMHATVSPVFGHAYYKLDPSLWSINTLEKFGR